MILLSSHLRHSPPARLAAAGFIAVVLFGNLWLAQALTGGHAPVWIATGFAAGVALALAGGIGLMVAAVAAHVRRGNGMASEGGSPGDDIVPAGGSPRQP